MAEKTWKEKRAEQDRANAISDAKKDATVNSKRGPIAKALTRVTRPVANAVMRNFEPPEYSKTYEQTYDAEMTGKPMITKGTEVAPKKMAKGGSVCRGGGAAVRGTKFSGVK